MFGVAKITASRGEKYALVREKTLLRDVEKT